MPVVCTWVCALSFGRCRMSRFWLLVYLGFFGSLRPALKRVGIGAVHEGVDRGGTVQVLSRAHLNPRWRGVPPERKSHSCRFFWVNHRERRLPMLVREKLQQ